jgi:cobalt-zinc-cadmium efflux system protein
MSGHDHTGHDHGHHKVSSRRLAMVILLNSAITIVEYVAGVMSGSLALISDAGHNLSDVLSLALGYAGEKISEKNPSAHYTFGLRRFETLVALVNTVSLVVIGVFIAVEAVGRFLSPVPINTSLMLPVAVFCLAGNLISVFLLIRDRSHSLNMRAAFLHLLYDSITSGAVIVVAIVLIFRPGWVWIDLLASLVIVVMIMWSSMGILSESLRVFLQAAPASVDPEDVRSHLMEIPGVAGVHELHIWSVDSRDTFMSCHVLLGEAAAGSDGLIQAINAMLAREFHIEHTSIQIEHAYLCKGSCRSCN